MMSAAADTWFYVAMWLHEKRSQAKWDLIKHFVETPQKMVAVSVGTDASFVEKDVYEIARKQKDKVTKISWRLLNIISRVWVQD